MKSQISPTYNHPVKRKTYLKIRMSSDVVLFHVVILLSQILVTKAVDTGGINTGGGSAYGRSRINYWYTRAWTRRI